MFNRIFNRIKHSYDVSKHCVTIDGVRLYLDKDDSLSLKHKQYEQIYTNWVRKNVKKYDYVVDVGANIGYYTTLLAKLVGEEGRVFAFEPETNNYNLLLKNINTNDFNNVYTHNSAVGRKSGKLKLYKSREELCGRYSNGMHRVYPSMFCVDEAIEVDVVTLDEGIWADHKISFVKIDAEGAELDILYGMKKILEQDHVSMILEYGPACVREKGDDPYKTIELLKNYGFKFNIADNGKIRPVKELDDFVNNLNDCQITDTNIKVANFLLIK